MDARQRRRRSRSKALWRVINPPTRPLAGVMPWWVLLETVGRRTGRPRYTPLAAGPFDGQVMWLIAAHGRHADFLRNIAGSPQVRVRHRRRWYAGTAALCDFDPTILRRFNRYARSSPRVVGIEPKLVKITVP